MDKYGFKLMFETVEDGAGSTWLKMDVAYNGNTYYVDYEPTTNAKDCTTDTIKTMLDRFHANYVNTSVSNFLATFANQNEPMDKGTPATCPEPLSTKRDKVFAKILQIYDELFILQDKDKSLRAEVYSFGILSKDDKMFLEQKEKYAMELDYNMQKIDEAKDKIRELRQLL